MNAEEFLVSINSKTKANLTMNRYTISGMFFYYTTQSKSISRLKQQKECKYVITSMLGKSDGMGTQG